MQPICKVYNKNAGIIEYPNNTIININDILLNKRNLMPLPLNKQNENTASYYQNLGLKNAILGITQTGNNVDPINFTSSYNQMNPNNLPNFGLYTKIDNRYALFTLTNNSGYINVYDSSSHIVLSAFRVKYTDYNAHTYFYYDSTTNYILTFYNRGYTIYSVYTQTSVFNFERYILNSNYTVSFVNEYLDGQTKRDGANYNLVYQMLNQKGNLLFTYKTNGNIIYYNFSTHTITTILTLSGSMSLYGAISNALENDLTLDANTYYRPYTSSGVLYITRVIIDYNNLKAYQVQCALDTKVNYNDQNGITENQYNLLIPFVHTDGINNYLTIVNVLLQPTSASPSNKYYLVTYRIDSSNSSTLYYVGYANIPNDSIIGIDYLSTDKNQIALIGTTGVYFYKFANNQQNLINAPQITNRLVAYVRDEYDRIQLTDTAKNCYLLSLYYPYTIQITSEKQDYTYDGTAINTYVKLNVYDFNNNRVSVNGTLVIKTDNAVFTDNNSKSINITTSDTTDTIVNLTIINSGIISFDFNINT